MDHFEPHLSEALSEVRTSHLMTMLEDCLYKAKRNKLHCSKVLVPKELTNKVAQDALKLSLTEPCGLRGCIIYVNLESENKCIKLDKLVYDSTVVPTFELTLVFKQDSQRLDYFRDLLINRTCFPIIFRSILKLSPKFLLTKRKLYFSVMGTGAEDC
ncbi:DNA damage-inducible transcript 4-like protein isoform 2-T2 [Discoglossus pictus]